MCKALGSISSRRRARERERSEGREVRRVEKKNVQIHPAEPEW
jgi:hypothetical protein